MISRNADKNPNPMICFFESFNNTGGIRHRMKHPSLDLSLPYITEGLEGIGGEIKALPEDFAVEEVPLYEASGHGSHLYVNITKVGHTTRDVQVRLAELFKLRPRNIGTAGLKDKNAVTTQTFSILFESGDVDSDEAMDLIQRKLDVRVNGAKFHDNKLRAGHLIGNNFQTTITGLRMSMDRAVERAGKIAEMIHRTGFPNYYGEQRTGRWGRNVRDGWEIIMGGRRPKDRWLGKLLVAGYQSYLCNRYLAERVRRGLFGRVMLGDIAKKHDTGGIFWVNDPRAEQVRFDVGEISFTAPIFGYKMSKPLGKPGTLEDEIIEESGVSLDDLKRVKLTGTRRFGRLVPRIEVAEVPRGIRLSFMLHKGGYATSLLREFMKA
jgi:tRNA pseudouridine13 synthase